MQEDQEDGCNVLLIQKSILRDAVNELALHFLAKLKILVVKDVERDEIEFVSKTLGAKPIADIEAFTEDKLASADLIDETQQNGARVVKITGIKNMAAQLAFSAPEPTRWSSRRASEVCTMPCVLYDALSRRKLSSQVEELPKSTSRASYRNTRKHSKEWKPTASKPTPKRSKSSPPPLRRTPVSTQSALSPNSVTVTLSVRGQPVSTCAKVESPHFGRERVAAVVGQYERNRVGYRDGFVVAQD